MNYNEKINYWHYSMETNGKVAGFRSIRIGWDKRKYVGKLGVSWLGLIFNPIYIHL